MAMNRWKLLALYLPLAAGCWGIEHVAGVKDGTGLSAGIGWGGGLILMFVVLALRQRWRPAFRVERWRSEAARLRVEDPATYEQILAQASPEVQTTETYSRDPDSFVALFLAAAADEGLLT
jgi:hypothetical protein